MESLDSSEAPIVICETTRHDIRHGNLKPRRVPHCPAARFRKAVYQSSFSCKWENQTERCLREAGGRYASEIYQTSNRRLSAKLVPTFADRRVSRSQRGESLAAVISFLDRSRYFFFQVAPQLYSRGWVDPVADPLLLRKSGSAGNWTEASGSSARNSDH
jgi:hypothetical protein